MKRIVLCADDYAQDPWVSQGVVQLLEKKRLSAVSCLTTANTWFEHGPWLKPFADRIDVGLHFNLTQGKSLTGAKSFTDQGCFKSLGFLLKSSHLGKLKQDEVERELEAQLDRYTEVMGNPKFIDGHQHVHQFPTVRQGLLAVLERRYTSKDMPYVRSTYPLVGSKAGMIKPWVIAHSGAKPLLKQLDKRHIAHNTSFSGVYNFKLAKQFKRFLSCFLNESSDGGLIMCHPGMNSLDEADPLWQSRKMEWDVLASDEFIDMLEEHVVMLAPLARK